MSDFSECQAPAGCPTTAIVACAVAGCAVVGTGVAGPCESDPPTNWECDDG
jgi:hypothetical protein